MSDEPTPLIDRIVDEESRRSFLKKGTVATAAAGLGAVSSGSVAADDDGSDANALQQEQWKGLMFTDQVRPNANFVITSPVLQWIPNVEDVRDNIWSEYNTRMIRYLGTSERATLFQAQDAEVPNYDPQAGYVVDAEGDTGPNDTPQPEVYNLNPNPALFGDSDFLMEIQYGAVGEDEEDDLLDNEDWWYDDGGDGAGGGDGGDGAGGGDGTTTSG